MQRWGKVVYSKAFCVLALEKSWLWKDSQDWGIGGGETNEVKNSGRRGKESSGTQLDCPMLGNIDLLPWRHELAFSKDNVDTNGSVIRSLVVKFRTIAFVTVGHKILESFLARNIPYRPIVQRRPCAVLRRYYPFIITEE